jgi:Bifunctional DNA primase/polymerase, N-terminal
MSASQPRTFANAIQAALFYIALGFAVVPIAFGQKRPRGNAWQELRIDAPSVSRHFKDMPQNIGILLGISGLTDIDLDVPEALLPASTFLPETGMVFGRASKPASHYLYFADPALPTEQFRDPLTNDMLVELRGLKKDGTVGLQTVAPGSTHMSGEAIAFEPGRDLIPTGVDPNVLIRATRTTAAATLLARYWPAKGRHVAMMALAGALARGGWPLEKALIFCPTLYKSVPTHDPFAISRVDSEVRDSYTKVAAGEAATGFLSLTEHIDKKVVKTAFGWLDLKSSPSAQVELSSKDDWEKQLSRNANGVPKPLLANALIVMRNAPDLKDMVAYNSFSLTTVVRRPPLWRWQSQPGSPWGDFDDSHLAAWFQRHGISITTRIAAEAAETIAKENEFNPAQDYMNSRVWDGTKRIDNWLATYLGTEDSG